MFWCWGDRLEILLSGIVLFFRRQVPDTYKQVMIALSCFLILPLDNVAISIPCDIVVYQLSRDFCKVIIE